MLLAMASTSAASEGGTLMRCSRRPGFGSYAMLSLLGSGPIYLSFERDADANLPADPVARG